jgi:hypothetical protein
MPIKDPAFDVPSVDHQPVVAGPLGTPRRAAVPFGHGDDIAAATTAALEKPSQQTLLVMNAVQRIAVGITRHVDRAASIEVPNSACATGSTRLIVVEPGITSTATSSSRSNSMSHGVILT